MIAICRYISICLICHLTLGSVSYKEKDFLANLTWNYDPKIRPVLDGSNTTVSISMMLNSVLTLDEKQEVLSFKASFVMTWKDQLLVWNSTNSIPIAVTMPLADVWSPTVLNVDSVTDLKYLKDERDNVLVHQDGTVLYSFTSRLDTECKVNIRQFPFDRQTCIFHLQTLYVPVTKEILKVVDSYVNLETYKENGEFHLLSAPMALSKFQLRDTSGNWIEVILVLQRRTAFYILNNILPIVFLSFLNVFVFLLPEESGEKVSFSVSILLSYAMFLTLINSYLPANSDHVCFFSVYVALLVLISTLTCLVTISIQLFHTNLQRGNNKVRASETRVRNEDVPSNQVKDSANKKKPEIKDVIIPKCNRMAFGTFLSLTVLINLMFFIAVCF